MGGGVVAAHRFPLDAEVAAVVRGIETCLMMARPGDSFSIFTDSQVAVTRMRDNRVGPGCEGQFEESAWQRS